MTEQIEITGIHMVKRILATGLIRFATTAFLTFKHVSAQVERNKKPTGGLYFFRMYIDSKPSGSSEMLILNTRGIR